MANFRVSGYVRAMKVHEIMTAHARGIAPDNTLVEAAGLMRELDVGALPVFNGEELTGMVTDRDMVLRGIADGRDPTNTSVGHVMSQGVIFVMADQEVEEVARIMQEKQVRRLPVLNAEKRLVGIVSIGDIAISSNPAFTGMALRDVSQPASPTTRQRRLSQASEPSRVSTGGGNNSGAAPKEKSAVRSSPKSGATGAKKKRSQLARAKVTSGRGAARTTSQRKSTRGTRKTPARSR